MNWNHISDIGNSRIVKSMYIWMVTIPIVAKLMTSASSIQIPYIAGEINLSLPFSWQVFFFCSLFFSLANLIYQFKCPQIIKKYSNYSDFEAKDKSSFLLINYLAEHVTERIYRKHYYEIGVIVSKYTPSKDIAEEWTADDTSNVNWRKGIDSLIHSKYENIPDLFFSIRSVVSNLYKPWFYLCFGLYTIGFIGLGIVFLQNIKYVVERL